MSSKADFPGLIGFLGEGCMEYGYTTSACPTSDPVICTGGVFTECSSNPHQPAFRCLLQVLKPGDSLVIPTLSVFGSSLQQICGKWNEVERKDVTIRILDFPKGIMELDTASLGSLFNYASEAIQTQLRMNQQAGYEQAKRAGKHMGRKPMQIPQGFEALQRQYRSGEISAREAAMQLNVSVTTFLRWSRDDGSNVTGKKERGCKE